MLLDILYFLGYNIDDELPWHSTLSRTKQLYPESVFEKVFERVLLMCVEKGTLKDYYFTRRKDCSGCPIKTVCIKKNHERRISITAYKQEYDRAIKRVNSREGRYMKKKRQSTVEPVFGTLINYMVLRKINTLGINQAGKVMLMSAMAYNLKKYIKTASRTVQSMAQQVSNTGFYYIEKILSVLSLFRDSEFVILNH